MIADLAARLPRSLSLGQEGAVAVVTLARPEKRNALDDETVLGLETLFRGLAGVEGIGAVVLNGQGGHFCAGLDLSALRDRDVMGGIQHSRLWHRAFETIQYGPVPVVAVLTGATIGGGLELAAATHVRVAERNAFYALPEGQRGIFVGGGGSMRLPRLIGVARMMDLMLTGRSLSAEEGVAVGLSQYVVDEGAGLATAMTLAQRIAGNARMTNFAVLQALPRIADSSPEVGLLTEALISAIAQASPEAKARVEAFLAGKAAKVERG